MTETTSTLIDHAYCNRKDFIVEAGVIGSGLSDHRLIYVVRRAVKPRLSPREITTRSYKRFNVADFCADLSFVPWQTIEIFDDVDECWSHFKTLFNEVAD